MNTFFEVYEDIRNLEASRETERLKLAVLKRMEVLIKLYRWKKRAFRG